MGLFSLETGLIAAGESGAGRIFTPSVPVSDAEWATRYDEIVQARGKQPEAQRLHALFDLEWYYSADQFPENATYNGEDIAQDRFTDLSLEAIAARRAHVQLPLDALHSIDRTALVGQDVLSYDLFLYNLELQRDSTPFPEEYMLFNQMQGAQQDPANTIAMMPGATVPQMETQLARLRAVPRLIDQTVALLRDAVNRGIVPPAVILRDVPQQIQNQLPKKAADSSLLLAFESPAATLPAEQATRLREEAEGVFDVQIRPAYERLAKFVDEVYLPAAAKRPGLGLTALPNGEAWYAWRVRQMTTTDLTPKQIHEIGLREVARIDAEIDRVMRESGWTGTREEFFHFLRTDPRFYHTDKQALLTEYRDISKRIDGQLPKFFSVLPRNTYGVEPIPPFAEKSQTAAYYQQGSLEAGRSGTFFANTYALESRARWEMVTLTLHEAVPGHHLQISLAEEMTDLPKFRRFASYTGYLEGWALYSESLGEEMGMYDDPYKKMGELSFDMWRAVRLVVDTGLHAYGWSRQQAIDYFASHAPRPLHDIEVEIDRYIAWPGQALAYKLGQLEIKDLRALATRELGPRFDLRKFHDEILCNGAVPLHVLDTHMRAWIDEQKNKK